MASNNLVALFDRLMEMHGTVAKTMETAVVLAAETEKKQSDLSRIEAYDELLRQFQEHSAQLEEYANVSSPVDAWARFPVKKRSEMEILAAIKNRIGDYVEQNPKWRPVADTLRNRLNYKIFKKFKFEQVCRSPAKNFEEIIEHIAQYNPDPGLYAHMSCVLLEKRAAVGLTQEQVAAFIGINQKTYQKWETGKCPPGPKGKEKALAFLATDNHIIRQQLQFSAVQGKQVQQGPVAQASGVHVDDVSMLQGRQNPVAQSLPSVGIDVEIVSANMPKSASADIGRAKNPKLLREMRKGAGLSLGRMAMLLGVPFGIVRMLEEGEMVNNAAGIEARWIGRLSEQSGDCVRVSSGVGRARNPVMLHGLREAAGLTIKEVAGLLGVSANTVWKLENGRTVSNVAFLESEWLRRVNPSNHVAI